MAIQQPPVLKKVKQPTDEQSIELLASIDSRLENIEVLNKTVTVAKKTVTTKKKKAEKEVVKKPPKPIIHPHPVTPPFEDFDNIEDKKRKSWWSDKFESLKDELESGRKDGSKLEKGLPTMAAQMTRGIMGPLNLIAQPLGDFFGFQMEDVMDSILFKKDDGKKSDSDYKQKGKFVKPKRSDILKSNPEAAFIVDELTRKDKQKQEDSANNGLLSALGMGGAAGIAQKLWPALLKAAPFAAIAGGLVWAAIDGLKTMGEAEKWGVDKVPAFLGGFFSGSGEGWKAVLSNSAKWGLVGAGVGMLVGGPIGAIAGALLGAALGGVFNWIGAENVSKTFNDIAIKLGLTEDKTQAGKTQDDIFKKKDQIAGTYEKLWDQGKFDDATFGENSFKKTEKIKRVLNAKNYSSFTADAYGSNAMYLMDELNTINSLFSTLEYLPKDQAKGKRDELEAKQKAIIDALGKLDYDEKTKKTNADFLFNELNTKFGYSFSPFEKQKESGVVKVNDAIISPDGRIVQPSSQDTIIATKSPVFNSNFDTKSYDYTELSKAIETAFSGREIVDAIQQLINVVQNKPFNTIIQNQQPSIDFNQLRFN